MDFLIHGNYPEKYFCEGGWGAMIKSFITNDEVNEPGQHIT